MCLAIGPSQHCDVGDGLDRDDAHSKTGAGLRLDDVEAVVSQRHAPGCVPVDAMGGRQDESTSHQDALPTLLGQRDRCGPGALLRVRQDDPGL
jgi:hypothetical protein